MTVSERKREDILNGAIEEFREHGFTASRTSRIAQRAGVSSRTLYKHFETKEALFEAIVRQIFDRASYTSEAELDPERSLREQLIEILDHYVDAMTNEQMLNLNRIAMAEFLRDKELARRAMEKNACHTHPIQSLISQAMEKGMLRKDDVGYASERLVALTKSFFYFPMLLLGELKESDRSREQIIEDCVDMFLDHYALKPGP